MSIKKFNPNNVVKPFNNAYHHCVVIPPNAETLFISGQLSIDADGKMTTGKIGQELNLEQGQEAAYLCALNIIAQVKKACKGDIDKVNKCIKLTGYINSSDNFTDQPKVINKASKLISNLFGKNEMHTRAAISANSLPLGSAVEIDAIFEIN